MRTRGLCVTVALVVLFAGTASAQKIPTGTLTGTVTDGSAPLPGVTVTVTSPNQQGARVAHSTVNGDYLLELLPPGFYTVRFELDGFQTVDTTVKVSSDLRSRVDALMSTSAKFAEEITVVGRYETISATSTGATTYESKLIQVLPVSRDVSGYVDLSPATVLLENDAYYYQQIAGAVASENLYLINGATATENVRGSFLPLYVEDAIQEATTSLSCVSAEYGRFTGGVVNVLTKSGGNEFHGSLRLNLTNPKWSAPTPVTIERVDHVDDLWEATFGGRVLTDKLWFFLSGRTVARTTQTQTYPPVSIPVEQTHKEDRYEAKLTLSPTSAHRLIGSYLDLNAADENYFFQDVPVYDLENFYSRQLPEDIQVLNYSGVLSDSFFLEAQFSARHRTFSNVGSRYTDVERGTPVFDLANMVVYNSPFFCAVCPDPGVRRDNKDAFLKASMFVSTEKSGSHDLRFGVDLYDDMQKVNNWQSGSGYWLFPAAVNIVGTGTDAAYYPVVMPGSTFLAYFPIFELSRGSHFKTQSAFVNDVWRLDNRFSFNIGVRYDRNDGTDASGATVVRDSKWSPRLSITWDPKGDATTQVTLGYGEYVASIQTYVADSQASGGNYGEIDFLYDGPPINTEGNELETHEALQQIFAWLDGIGGPMANPQLWFYANVPGYQTFVGDSLRSPSTREWAASVSRRMGTRGLVRLDYINKVWSDFYSQRVDTTTGSSTDPYGNVYDRRIVENDDTFTHRKYWALMLQGDYRFGDRLQAGGNYTYSKLYGNDYFVTMGGSVDLEAYPEYRDLRWYAPTQYLWGDRRHKLNLYAAWDVFHTAGFDWNVSALQRYLSGTPYGAWSSLVLVGPYVTNPGYAVPPDLTRYAFTAPDAYRTGAVTSTDLAMTFSFKVVGVEFYLNPRVTNVFNKHAVVNPDTTVYTAYNQDYLTWFDPFTETPRECPQGTTCDPAAGYNWQKGPDFGKALQPSDYQLPRTFLLNVGVRF